MSHRLPSLTSLRAFEAAARLRSFKHAADELAVTAAAISHRIRDLEAFLGCPLFVRKVRAVELTHEAHQLYGAVRDGFELMATTIDQLRSPRRASVTLSVTPAFATKWLVPRLVDFQTKHPGIDLHVHASNEPVSLTGGVADLAVRYGSFLHNNHEDFDASILLEDCYVPVARPGLPVDVEGGLKHWPLIHFECEYIRKPVLNWTGWAKAAGVSTSAISTGIRYSEEVHAIQAAIAGQGVALLSHTLIKEELRLGLLRIVEGPRLTGVSYYLLRPRRSQKQAAIDTVAEWLIQSANDA